MELPRPIVAFLQVAVPFRSWPRFCAENRPSCRFVALVVRAIWALLTMDLMASSVYDEGTLWTDARTSIELMAVLPYAFFSFELCVLLIRVVVQLFR